MKAQLSNQQCIAFDAVHHAMFGGESAWNAPESAFNDQSQYLFQGKSVDDIFVFNTANYRFCGVEILPSFSCHDVLKHGVRDEDLERLSSRLDKYIN